MPEPSPDFAVVGAGIFGAATALELAARGASVTLLDPGPLPHPDAASTDISKLVRGDYGTDAFYTDLADAALPLWRAWNARLGAELFHETGLAILSTTPLEAGGFEGDSFRTLLARGVRPARLDAGAIAARLPGFRPGVYVDGYVSAGGWVESGRVVAGLLAECARAGVRVVAGARVRPIPPGTGRLGGVDLEGGDRVLAGEVVVCAGAFTPVLVPELADRMTPVGQPVLHFASEAPELGPPAMLPWAADIARSGWYGFPRHEGVVKVANHGRGVVVDPAAPRVVPEGALAAFRAFFAESIPRLVDAPHVRSRLCLYCDSFDGDFLIDRHPERPDLTVAAGGSGHAFKFAPLLGRFAAARATRDPAEPAPWHASWHARFAWRERSGDRLEAARAPT